MVGAVLFIVLFIAALTMPVPYAVLSPGPTFNTLGKDANGTEVIVLHGKASRPVSGHLNMTTVNVSTADSISVIEAIRELATAGVRDVEEAFDRNARFAALAEGGEDLLVGEAEVADGDMSLGGILGQGDHVRDASFHSRKLSDRLRVLQLAPGVGLAVVGALGPSVKNFETRDASACGARHH